MTDDSEEFLKYKKDFAEAVLAWSNGQKLEYRRYDPYNKIWSAWIPFVEDVDKLFYHKYIEYRVSQRTETKYKYFKIRLQKQENGEYSFTWISEHDLFPSDNYLYQPDAEAKKMETGRFLRWNGT